tara:strand:+ start:296 stop:529 length:234 start_codon:yes stop_codon:yes gene_type:complete
MSDVITYAMSGTGPYQSTTINNGGILVGSPRGSGFIGSNYTFGEGYNGANTTSSTLPTTGTVFINYDTSFTGCPPCS